LNATILTKALKREYAAAIRIGYQRANKLTKKQILDEFVKVTGCHRKAAIRLLHQQSQPKAKHPGRPSRYHNILGPLKDIWEASDRLCSKRRQPFIPEMI